ncbi:MAG: glycosyltransferase family 39 protein [Anaerolineae bacterium]|nr:glycosyltransferase family 39 protein [Anaerolineae bacterium]
MENPSTQADDHEAASSKVLRTLAIIVLLLITLAAGAYLRLVGLDWDENQHLHPDERFLTMVGSGMTPAATLADYFDTTRSSLNPNNIGYGFFVYGDLPIILVRYVGEAVSMTSYYNLYLVGRAVSSVADLLTLLVLFFIGRKLFDWRAGLLAAVLYAAAALPIQLSHFYTVDTVTNLFAITSLLMIVRVTERHNWVDYPLFGIMLGLGMASKVSIFPIAFILMLALLPRTVREHRQLPDVNVDEEASENIDEKALDRTSRRLIGRAVAGLVIAGLVTVLAFRIGQPYAFLPPNSGVPIDPEDGAVMGLASRLGDPIGMRLNPEWLSQMNEVRSQVSGNWDAPPNHQWAHRPPLIFPWVNMVRVGLGWPLGIWCWLAFAWAIWEIARRHQGSGRLILPVIWVGLFFTWQGIAWVKTMRYFLSVYPVLILLGAWALITLWDRIEALLAARNAPRRHWARLIGLGLAAIVLISSYAWGFAVSRIYTRPVTRIEASRWTLENIPSDVTLLIKTPTGQREFQLGLHNNEANSEQSEDETIHPSVPITSIRSGSTQSVPVSIPFDGTLVGIRFNHISDPANTDAERTLQVMLTSVLDGNKPLVDGQITADFPAGDDAEDAGYLLEVDPVEVKADQSYNLTLILDDQGPLHLLSANVAIEGDWDDPLPLPLPNYYIWNAQYQGYELEMAWEDIPEKRERFQYILDKVDYIIISSNRFYASLPRNPQRYPMTIAYYQALFSGDLGFDLIGDFTSRPSLGPIQFHDDDAEEAWTVYDHPRVLVFRKSERYASSHVAEILGSADMGSVVRSVANGASGPPVVIPLPEKVQEPEQSGKNTNSLNTTAEDTGDRRFFVRFQPITVILWWLLILAFGWLAFPTLYVLLPGLADRGYPLSRIFSLLVAAWVGWMLARSNIVPWSGWSAVIGLGTLALLSALLIYPHREEFTAWLTNRRRHLIVIEVIFTTLFLGFVLIRLGNPDLWHPTFGGEKPMDLAYFNAVIKSQTLPPYDPWFAGGTLEYYYFGYVIVGLPLKILPIPLTLAYNLILPTLFALTGTGAFSVAYNLIARQQSRDTEDTPTPDEDLREDRPPTLWETLRAWPHTSWGDIVAALRGPTKPKLKKSDLYPYSAGVAALLLTAILGNLDEIRILLWGLAKLGAGTPQWTSHAIPNLGDVVKGLKLALGQDHLMPVGLGEWYWNATRLIPIPSGDTITGFEITEFPFFTFLYADLHAHMIAIPITLLAILWSVAQVRAAGLDRQGRGSTWQLLLSVVFGALIIGSLRPTNTWDWPTYLVLGMGALMLAHFYRRKNENLMPALGMGIVTAALIGGLVYAFIRSSDPAISLTADRTAQIAVLGSALVGLSAGFALGKSFTTRQYSTLADAPDRLSPWLTLVGSILLAGGLAVLSFLLYPPYILTYRTGYSSLIAWTGSRTPLWAYIDILGLFLFLIISWMIWESWKWRQEIRQTGSDWARLLPPIIAGTTCLGVSILGIIVVAVLQNCPVVALAVPLIIWAIILFFRSGQPIEKRAILAIISAALALTVMVELIVLQGDIGRMNTVFKFYVQVWILMAAAAGTLFGWLWPAIKQAKESIRTPWIAILVLLVSLAALYPLLATHAKIIDRWSNEAPHTLDGMAYMRYVERYENGVSFSLEPDYHALRWIQDNIKGTPTILEAHVVEYHWGNRVSVYTGLPAVIGWNWHQRQQHTDRGDEIWQRVTDVAAIYNTTDTEQTLSLLRHYNVDLIMVGELERACYDPAGLEKFKRMAELGHLKMIYDRDNTIIYEMSDE